MPWSKCCQCVEKLSGYHSDMARIDNCYQMIVERNKYSCASSLRSCCIYSCRSWERSLCDVIILVGMKSDSSIVPVIGLMWSLRPRSATCHHRWDFLPAGGLTVAPTGFLGIPTTKPTTVIRQQLIQILRLLCMQNSWRRLRLLPGPASEEVASARW